MRLRKLPQSFRIHFAGRNGWPALLLRQRRRVSSTWTVEPVSGSQCQCQCLPRILRGDAGLYTHFIFGRASRVQRRPFKTIRKLWALLIVRRVLPESFPSSSALAGELHVVCGRHPSGRAVVVIGGSRRIVARAIATARGGRSAHNLRLRFTLRARGCGRAQSRLEPVVDRRDL